MAVSVLWRALLAQTVAVAAVFALLLALPLPPEFFRAQGSFVGPLSWLACSLIASRAIGSTVTRGVVAAVVSGLVAAGAGLSIGHTAGIVVGLLAFAVTASLRTRPGAPPGWFRLGRGG